MASQMESHGFLCALASRLLFGSGESSDAKLDGGQSAARAALLRSDCRFIGPSTSLSLEKSFSALRRRGQIENWRRRPTTPRGTPHSGNYKFRQWIMKSDFWARGSVKASPNEAQLFEIGSVARLLQKGASTALRLNAMHKRERTDLICALSGCGWCTSGLIDLHHNKVVDMCFVSTEAAFCAKRLVSNADFRLTLPSDESSRTIRSFSSFLLVDFTPWWCA